MSDIAPSTAAAASPAQSRDPVLNASPEVRAEVIGLLERAGYGSLSWRDAQDGHPGISRIAFAFDPKAGPLTAISGLAPHFAALKADPACALMVEDGGAKGDPMTRPRVMIRARANFLPREAENHAEMQARWIERNPKAKIYIGLSDFRFVRLEVISALYNGGFGRAFRLSPQDLTP